MSVFRNCLKPLIVTKGSDQLPISTRYFCRSFLAACLLSSVNRFELREDISVIRNYGALLLDVAKNVADGICCFFTSYKYMEEVVAKWDEMRILCLFFFLCGMNGEFFSRLWSTSCSLSKLKTSWRRPWH
jgi:DNA excision repair protein ERCC-2